MLRSFFAREEGQGLVEYALIIALVSIALVAALIALRGGVGNALNRAATELTNAGS